MKRRSLLQRIAGLLAGAAALPAVAAVIAEPEENESTEIGTPPRFTEDWTKPYRVHNYGLKVEIDPAVMEDDIYHLWGAMAKEMGKSHAHVKQVELLSLLGG